MLVRSLYLKCNELKVRGTHYRRKKRLNTKWWVLYTVEKNYKGAIFFNALFLSASHCTYMHGKLFWAQPSTEAIRINPGGFFSD